MDATKPTIVAVSGWKRSGKDTVAEFLTRTYQAQRLGFADPLKDSVAKKYGIDRASIDDPALKESPLLSTPVDPRDAFSRNLCQFMVLEFRDENGNQPTSWAVNNLGKFGGLIEQNGMKFWAQLYWTRRALCILEGSTARSVDPDHWVKKAVSQTQPGGLYVISDLRYVNEAETLKKTGANVITVRINRFDTSPSQDPSERDLDNYNFDVVISNKGTLEQLLENTNIALIDRGIVTLERSQAY